MNIVEGAYKDSTRSDKAKLQAIAESYTTRHVIREIYDFESDFFKREGRKPTNDERDVFMEKLEKYITKQYKTGINTTAKPLVTFDDQAANTFKENEIELEKSLEKEEQRQKDETVISTGIDGEAITLRGYVDTVLENFEMIDPPRLRKTIIEGIISEDDKYRQQTLPKIQKYITSIVGDTMTKEVFEMMSTADYQDIVKQVASNLKMTTGNKKEDQKIYKQLDKIFQTLIGE